MASNLPPTRCVLASSNQGKLNELAGALASHHIDLLPQTEFAVEDAIEDGSTFIENSLIKSRHASAATGLAALADDSGLVVPILNGEPGIYSARYAANSTDSTKPSDTDNIQRLLDNLKGQSDRSAYFVCVLTYLRSATDPEPIIAVGRWFGNILETPQGNDGFGYDPVFFCPASGMSAASMGKEKKRAISHRALAIKQLSQQLTALA